MKSTICGYAMAIFTIMMWSLNIIYSKFLSGILSASEISFYRWVIGFFVMLPIAWSGLKTYWRLLPRYWHIILLMALTGIGFQNWFIYKAGDTIDATTMSLISVSGPIFLILLSRQRVSFLEICGMLLAIVGVADIILRGDWKNIATFQFEEGDFYMLGSALMFAVYAIVEKKAPANIPSTVLLTAAIAVCAIIFFFPSLPDLMEMHFRKIPKLTMVIIVILGIMNSAFAYLSWDLAIRKIGAVNTGIMYYTMPIFAIIFAFVLLGEKIYESQILGAIMIVAGVIMVILGRNK